MKQSAQHSPATPRPYTVTRSFQSGRTAEEVVAALIRAHR